MERIAGRIQILGDNIDTDQILPGYAMTEPLENLGKYALKGSKSKFHEHIKSKKILVAGSNFGCGSSREQAPIALKQAGVQLIVAKSFARIFRRNAINIGLPVVVADLLDLVDEGDYIEADIEDGKIYFGQQIIAIKPLSDSVLRTLKLGGLIPRIRIDLGIEEN